MISEQPAKRQDRLSAEWLAQYANPVQLEIAMPTRNVVLTNHQASFVEQLVSSGRYQNANEVLREWSASG